jgi:hypothetical protein
MFAFATLIAQVEGFATIDNASSLLVLVVPVLAIVLLLPIFAFREAACMQRTKTRDSNVRDLLMHPKKHTEAFCVSPGLCVQKARAKHKQTTHARRMKIVFQGSAFAVTALDIPASQVHLAAKRAVVNKAQCAQNKVYARAKKAPCVRQTLTAYLASLAKKECVKLRQKEASVDKIANVQTATVCQDLYLRSVLAMYCG